MTGQHARVWYIGGMKTSYALVALAVVFTAGAYAGKTVSVPTVEARDAVLSTARSPVETVIEVKDGDTFQIKAEWSPYDLNWNVRVLGVDTPEKGHRAACTRERDLSAEASALTTKLLRGSGGKVRLRKVKHDKYGGRLDAEVILADGSSLGERLIAAKLAKRYGGGTKPSWCF